MLTGKQKDKIIKGVLNNFLSEEINVCSQLRNDLVKFLFDAAIRELTDDEIDFIKSFPEFTENTLYLDFTGKFIDVGEKLISLDYMYSESFSIPLTGTIDGVTIDIPNSIDILKLLEDNHKDDYKKAINMLKEYVLMAKRISYKHKKVINILKDPNLNLTQMKDNFKELYNIVKS